MNRREFVSLSLAATGLAACNTSVAPLRPPKIFPDQSAIGHWLRQKPAKPIHYKIQHSDICIVGTGIAALSAARYIQKNSSLEVVLLDMSTNIGGNAAGGSNTYSAYPWAAHYLPIPSPEMEELIAFLYEIGVVTDIKNKIPTYREDYLCFDNQERLYIHGKWQDGLVPAYGLPATDQSQIRRFFEMMHAFKQLKGKDDKYVFNIPVRFSTSDTRWHYLANISASQWLIDNHFDSSYLLWYIEYCMSDDYGSNLQSTSAWACIHYFASRRGQSNNAKEDDVLTWPAGNQFLSTQLQTQISFPIQLNELALYVEKEDERWAVYHIHTATKQWTKTLANHIIMNTPFHVLKKIFTPFDMSVHQHLFQAYPWIIANITMDALPEKSGMELSWDNVMYQSGSLGFIFAQHQDLRQHHAVYQFTYYKALNKQDASTERKLLYAMDVKKIQQEIIDELSIVYPSIRSHVRTVIIRKIGHGMIAPSPGLLFSKALNQFQDAIAPGVYVAHTDYCGMSIFEEAFYSGLTVAKKILLHEE